MTAPRVTPASTAAPSGNRPPGGSAGNEAATGRGDRGIVLLAVIVLSLVLALWLAVLAVRVREVAGTVAGLQARLQAQNAAENCVAGARAILAATEPNLLLRGPDGVFGCPDRPEFRNPVSLDVLFGAAGPDSESSCDDGFPANLVPAPADPAVRQGDGAVYYLRFSNNPEEGGWEDHDGVVLARCFGSAGGVEHPARNGTPRAAAMIEVRLRRESPAPGSSKAAVRLEYWRPLFPEMEGVFR